MRKNSIYNYCFQKIKQNKNLPFPILKFYSGLLKFPSLNMIKTNHVEFKFAHGEDNGKNVDFFAYMLVPPYTPG